jgi:Uma2 family endonuclease
MPKSPPIHEKPRLHLGVADHDRRVSRAEYAEAVYDEPWRYERVRGKLSVMAPAGPEHQDVSNRVRDFLGAYALAHSEIVERVYSEAWIEIDASTDRIIDIGVYLIAGKGTRPGPKRPPDLAFEIVSGGGQDRKRDYIEKRAEYLSAGVKEYVIVDRFERRVTVLRRSRGRFVESHLQRTESYTSPLLPGLEIPLAYVFSQS